MTMNELELARTLREAMGLEQPKAERLSIAIFDAIRDNVATKADLHALAQTTKADLHALAQTTKADLRDAVHQLTIRGVGTLVSSLGILFWALHRWPPHV